MGGRNLSNIEHALVANRPEAPATLVDEIAGRVSPRRSSTRFRLGLAGALTTGMLVVVGATGGFAAAAHALNLSTKHGHGTGGGTTPACSQYTNAPMITKVSPSKGRVGKRVTIKGLNFLGPKPHHGHGDDRHHGGGGGGEGGGGSSSSGAPVTSVTLSGVAAEFRIQSNKVLKTEVPAGATTGSWVVTNCAGSATSSTFTVK